MIEIRPITVREIVEVSKFIPEFYKEFGTSPLGNAYNYDQDSFILTWFDWLRMPNYTLLGAFDNGVLVGGIGGMISRHPYTPDTMMGTEHFWYVKPMHRRTGVGKLLIAAFEEWLKTRGCRFMIMLYINGGPSERMKDFYTASGFLPFETQVCKEL